MISKSNFFKQSPIVLEGYRNEVIQVLCVRDFNDKQIGLVLRAYDYFATHPERYDGATASQDLEDIKGLEIAAMLHDWLYIALRAHVSVSMMRVADEMMKVVMKRFAKSGFEITRRMWLLALVRRPFAIYNLIKHQYKANKVAIYEAYVALVK